NLKRSIRYEGQIINNLLYPIYGKKPGRLIRILTGENASQTIALAAPPVENPNAPQATGGTAPQGGATPPPTGMTERVRGRSSGGAPTPGPAAGRAGLPGAPPPAMPQKQYRLTEHANYNVIVKVTRAFESRRTEEASTIADLLQANGQLMSWFGDLFFKNQ